MDFTRSTPSPGTVDPNGAILDLLAEEPQAPERKPRRPHRWIKPALFSLAILAGIWFVVGRMRGESAEAVRVMVREVRQAPLRQTVSATGVIQPWTVVDIKSKAGGRVDDLAVELGDHVNQGQIIARIDPSDSQLNVSTAKADIASAAAKQQQSSAGYGMQVEQSALGIQNAQAQVTAAQASLSAAQARYRTAADQAKAQPTRSQSEVQQAEASYQLALQEQKQLVSSQANERASTQSELTQAQASLKSAQTDLDRAKALFQNGYVAGKEVQVAETNLELAKAKIAAAQERVRTLAGQQSAEQAAQVARVAQAKSQVQDAKSQTDVRDKQNALMEAQAAISQQTAQLKQAQTALNEAISAQRNNEIKRLDITSAEASAMKAQATLQNAQETLDQTTVRAPSNGVVLQKYVEEGTIITSGMSQSATGTSIVQLGDVSRMYVNVTVDETDIDSIRVGQAVDVSVDAFPDESLKGKVTRISPQAKVEQNVTTIDVRVEIDNTSPIFKKLKPSMNATGEFIVDERPDTLSVPVEAVHTDDQGAYVEVAAGGKKAPDGRGLVEAKISRRDVKTGLEADDAIEIVSGLKPGEQVVTQTIRPDVAASPSSGSPFGGGGQSGSRGMGGGGRSGSGGGGGSRGGR